MLLEQSSRNPSLHLMPTPCLYLLIYLFLICLFSVFIQFCKELPEPQEQNWLYNSLDTRNKVTQSLRICTYGKEERPHCLPRSRSPLRKIRIRSWSTCFHPKTSKMSIKIPNNMQSTDRKTSPFCDRDGITSEIKYCTS